MIEDIKRKKKEKNLREKIEEGETDDGEEEEKRHENVRKH